MVKKIASFFAYTTFFIIALIVFTPKASVYFLFEKELKNFDVVISKEQLTENLFSLHISHLEITTKAIESAVIQKADISLLLLSNSVELQNIKLSSLVEAYLPSKIDKLRVTYTLVDPLHVNAYGEGEFGKAHLSFNVVDRALTLTLEPSKRMLSHYRNSLRQFKKSANGEYVYAQTF